MSIPAGSLPSCSELYQSVDIRPDTPTGSLADDVVDYWADNDDSAGSWDTGELMAQLDRLLTHVDARISQLTHDNMCQYSSTAVLRSVKKVKLAHTQLPNTGFRS